MIYYSGIAAKLILRDGAVGKAPQFGTYQKTYNQRTRGKFGIYPAARVTMGRRLVTRARLHSYR